MARWWPTRRDVRREVELLTAARRREREAWSARLTEPRDSLAAAVSEVPASSARRSLTGTVEGWQREAWEFYDTLGEFNFAVTWKSRMISRVRLRAARMTPDADEPEIVDTGPAVDLVRELGDVGGLSDILETLATFVNVPGEGLLIGETVGGVNRWQARSVDEVRTHNGRFEVVDENAGPSPTSWRRLGSEALVARVWRPHKRYRQLATSPARSARPAMRELDLVNRKIQAQYLSRLASAGVLALPEEVTFPVRPEFMDAPDPFVREWIEVAAEAIATPGSPASVIPIPLRMPGEFVDKVRLIDFTLALDDRLIEKRDSAIRRLATAVDVPAEIILGLGDVNHWSAWQLEEGAIKAHIAPDVELICHALTTAYLYPRLRATGVVDPESWVVWYDLSELTLRPDRSANAVEAYDRLELSGEALRRETGFDESDRPTDDELEELVLRYAARQSSTTFTALELLTGTPAPSGTVAPSPGQDVVPGDPGDDSEHQGPPNTRDAPPQSSGERAVARRDVALRQARLRHAVRFDAGGDWELLHPPGCRDHLFSCPLTYAAYHSPPRVVPGSPAVHECWLSTTGGVVIGPSTPQLDTRDLIVSGASSARNGGRT